MADKNLLCLKEAVYAKLSGDSTLVTLLSGSNIFHGNPPKDVVYPCVIYTIDSDLDNPYNDSDETGKITAAAIGITIFSANSKSQESDNIEARIKTLLNGQRTLNTSDVVCYGCYRTGMPAQLWDENTRTWQTHTNYRAVWAPKP